MTAQAKRITEVKQTIESLINAGSTYKIDELDKIYHEDLHVVMVDEDDHVSIAKKEDFKNIFKAKLDAGAEPMNTWSKIHHIEADDQKAHVLVCRENDLNGHNLLLFLSIDLVFEDHRWQVIREVIFLRPEESCACFYPELCHSETASGSDPVI